MQHQPSLVEATAPYLGYEEGVSIEERTSALVRGLRLALEHHGASLEVLEYLNSQVTAYLDTSSTEVVWLTRAKHMLTYPLTKYLRNEPPSPPDVSFKPTGGLRAWMRQRLTVFNRKNSHLWYTWLQCKRASLPASDAIVEATYEKHFATLSTPDCPSLSDDLLVDQIFEDKTFLKVLDRVRTAVGRVDLTSEHMVSKTPSTSACFEQRRADGGSAYELGRLVGLRDDILYDHVLERMDFYPVVYGRGVRFNVVIPVYCRTGREDWAELADCEIQTQRPVKCCIQAVLEPMKVRVISKGEALPYYSMKSIQRAMHSSMRNMPCFRLIGRPFSPTDLIGLREMADEKDEWFSIDYSAATDGLSWSYSGRIFEYVIQDLPNGCKDIARRVLGPHSLHYPFMGNPLYRGEQANGQLMGSVLSFPILCLANLGLYLAVNAIHQRDWTMKQRLGHVLINGDDMIYAGPPRLWDKHVRMGDQIGLKMSVGKAYRHREYANINSTSVHYRIDGTSPPFQMDFLNVGLFYGQHKVQGGTDLDVDEERPLLSNVNSLLQGTLPNGKDHILSRFLTEHAAALRQECKVYIEERTPAGKLTRYPHTRNIFLPKSTGGMGVVPPPGWRFYVSEMDRRIGMATVALNSAPYSGIGPSPGFPLEVADQLLSRPWAIKFSAPPSDSIRLLAPNQKLSRFVTRAGVARFCHNRCAIRV